MPLLSIVTIFISLTTPLTVSWALIFHSFSSKSQPKASCDPSLCLWTTLFSIFSAVCLISDLSCSPWSLTSVMTELNWFLVNLSNWLTSVFKEFKLLAMLANEPNGVFVFGTFESTFAVKTASAGKDADLDAVVVSTLIVPRGSCFSLAAPRYNLPTMTGFCILPSSNATKTTSPTLYPL